MQDSKTSRRDFLKNAATITGGLVIAAPLAGCMSTESKRAPSSLYANGYYGWGYYGSSYEYGFFGNGYYGNGYDANGYYYGR